MSNTRKSKPETFNKGIVTDVTEQLQPAGSYRDATNIRITSLDGKHFAAQNINGTSVKVTLNAIPGKELLVFRPKTNFTPGETYKVDDITSSTMTLGVYLGLPGSSTSAAVQLSDPTIQFVMNSVLDLYTAVADAFNSVPAIAQHITFQATQDGLSYTLSQGSINAGYVLQRLIIGKLGTAADPDELGNDTDTNSFSSGMWLEKSSMYPFTDRFVVVGHYSFVNELYLYTQDKIPGQTQFGHIHKLVFDVSGELISQEVIYGNALTFQDTHKLIVRGIIENNCVQRLVWTDNLNPLRTINVLDDNLSALSLESLSATPQYQLSHPIVTNVSAGSLPTGMYEYGYKLLSAGGGDTSVSTLSNLVPVGLGEFDGNTFDMIGDIAIGVDNSGKSLEIKIKGLDTNFDTIKLYVIYYANNLAGAGQLFEVTEESFSGDEFTYVHSELDLSSPLILEEFTVQNNTWRFCKAIEVKDNILFAANLRSLPETFTFDAQIKRYKGIGSADASDAKLQAISERTDSTPASSGFVTNDSSFDNSIHRYWQLPIKDSKNNSKFRRILGGHTDNFDNADSGIRVSFHMEDRLAENKGSFGSPSTNSGPITESIIGQTPNPFLNEYPISVGAAQAHANPLYTSVKRGYQRGEIYRFAIVFYDRMGNPGFARYIGDIQMPNHEDDYWRFSRSNSKTAGISGTLTCEMDANCPDYRLSYVEGFWGPAQVDKIYNGVYTDSANPITSGYLPKGFKGGTLGQAEYAHRLTDLYIRFEVKLSNAVKESISGFKIVRAERTDGDRTVVTQGMLNPMGIAGGNDNLNNKLISGGFASGLLEENAEKHSFSNQFQFDGVGSFATDGGEFNPTIINHSYNGIFAFKLMPINFGVRKNIVFRSTSSYATELGFAYFSGAGIGVTGISSTYSGGQTNVDTAFDYKTSILNTYPNAKVQNNEFISFRYVDASNTYKFGWPANSKATHPNYFTFDSLDLMGKMISYQRKQGDKLKIVSVLSQFSQLRKDKGLSWRTPSGATFNAYTYMNGNIGPNNLPYNQTITPSYSLQFISEVGDVGQNDIANNANLPETAQFTNVKILTENGNSSTEREHSFVEWYVEDTGLYNKRAYENQASKVVNADSVQRLDNNFNIDDSEDIGFGEVKNSFMGFVGAGMVNRGAHDMIFTSWRSPEKVYNLANTGTINDASTYDFNNTSSNGIMGESGFFKHCVPLNLSKKKFNSTETSGNVPGSHYVSSYDICNPTLGLKIDGSILGINLLPEFYLAGSGLNATDVPLPSLVSIDNKNVLDYRFDDAAVKPVASKHSYSKTAKPLFFFPYRYLCNIIRDIPNQYGGNSYSAIASTRYISTGHFTAVTQDANSYAADVSGGDTFVNIFAYNKYKGMGADTNTGNNGTDLGSGSVSIPIESKINFDYTHHEHFKRGDYLLPTGPANGYDAPALSKNYDGIDKIDYFEVYSQESTTVGFLSDNSAFDCIITRFPNQIAYSNTKLSGDVYNAWDTFPPANFHDVDGNLGEINSLFLIRDNLYFLQERGVGNLLVNPRTVITDSSGGQIFTGTGDTVQDHSYISTEFGTIHQHSVCVSDNMAYWADAIHDELFSFDGRKLTSIGDITANKKFLRDIIGGYSYINTLGLQLSAYDYANTLKKFDRPLVNEGIHSVYDHKNNEAIFTFFDSYKLRNNSSVGTNKKNEIYNTIAYNEQLKLITSRYSYKPSYWISHDNRIYAISNSSTKSYSRKSLNLNLWDDELASLCTFENNAQAFSIKLILNEAPSISKIFDNLDIIYEGENQAGATAGNPNPFKFTSITFDSPEMDTTQTVSYINGDVESYRYGVLKLPIRNQTATNRLRGTYITTTILENVNMTRKYNIFAIGYKYRQSNR